MGELSKKALVDLINHTNADVTTKRLDGDQIVFSDPVETEEGTLVTILPSEGSIYSGSRAIIYQRIGLQTLFKLQTPKLEFVTVEDKDFGTILDRIKTTYGVVFDPDDVIISISDTADGTTEITITCDTDSLQFKDDIVFKTNYVKADLATWLAADSESFDYMLPFVNRTFAGIYSNGWKLSEVGFELETYQVGELADERLCKLAMVCSGDEWVNLPNTPIAFNIFDAVVTYNGPVNMAGDSLWGTTPLDADRIIIGNEKNVLTLELNSLWCPNLIGNLTYFY